MQLKWTDVQDIAIELAERKADVDPRYVNFVDLHRWVLELPDFADEPSRGGERCSKPSRPPGSKRQSNASWGVRTQRAVTVRRSGHASAARPSTLMF